MIWGLVINFTEVLSDEAAVTMLKKLIQQNEALITNKLKSLAICKGIL